MAYVDRFIFRFNSVSGKAVRIAIADNDYTGTAVERRLGGSPQLRCELSGNIHGMSLEIPAECEVDDEFAVLYTSDPTRFAVRLEVDSGVVWRGFVTPELYSAPWIDPPYDVQITATDGLGELKMLEWPAIGSRTLGEILETTLGATGLALPVRMISTAANDLATAADLLTGTTVNLDHMAGKSYYDVLDGLLGSLHCTILQRGGAWLLVRETDVTSLTSGGQVSDTSGGAYPVKAFGSSQTHDCWPVGRLTTEIVPAKSTVEAECPNHLASLIADPDMELNLWQTNGSWTGEDGGYYTLDLGEYISQTASVANATGDADPGFRIKVSSRHTTPFDVGIMRLTVMATGRDPRSGSDKTLYLKEVTTRGRTQMEWVTEESHFDDGLGLPKTLDHQDCKEFVTDIFHLPTGFNPIKTITIRVSSGRNTVCVHSVNIECMSVYDKAVTRLVMDNGARGDESYSPLFADSFVGNKGNFLLSNSLRGVAGAMVRTWSSDAIPSVPYGEWLSKDMALSVATPRLRMSGRLFTVTSLPALFYSNKGLSYITEEWSLDLIEDEADISLISLPAAALSTVSVSVIVEDKDGRQGAVSGGEIVSPKTGEAVSPSGTLDWFIAEAYEEDGETKYRLKLNPKYQGMYAEGWVSAGGISETGQSGVVSYLHELLDVNLPSQIGDGQALIWNANLQKWTSGDVTIDTTPFERVANKVTSVSAASDNTQYPTAKAVYDIVNTMLSSAMRFQGVTTTALVDGSTTNPVVIDGESYTATMGDVVVRSNVGLEYLWTGTKWQQLGDESSYAKKTVTITGSGYLTGGGNLEAARTLDIAATIKTKIDNGATAFGYFTNGAANEAVKLKTPRTIWGQSFDGTGNVNGTFYFRPGDATLKIYSAAGVIQQYGDEAVVLQSAFDNQDPETSTYPAQISNRCVIALQPRGGFVGVGTTSPDYELDVAGDIHTSGKVYIGTSGGYLEVVNVGSESAPEYALRSTLPLYSDSWVSSGGVSDQGGSGSASWLRELQDVDDNLNPDIGDALVWNGTQWVADDVTVDLSDYVTTQVLSTALNGYLPLTGGTVNGALTVRGGRTWIGSNAGDGSNYENYHGIRWGYHSVDHMDFYEKVFNFYNNGGGTPGLYVNGNTIWHAGNDGSGSGLDADLLDGHHNGDLYADGLRDYEHHEFSTRRTAGNFTYADAALHYYLATGSMTDSGRPGGDGYIMHLGWDNSRFDSQLWVATSDTSASQAEAHMKVRHHNNGEDSSWGDWHSVAMLDSNVASATKLATPRTIWGQSFDGTANVNGKFYFNNGDGTLKIYDVVSPYAASLGLESVAIQTAFDEQDPETSAYPESYGSRCLLLLQPRGGRVGVGTPSPAYTFDVHGAVGFGSSGACDVYLRRTGLNYIHADASSNAVIQFTANSKNVMMVHSKGVSIGHQYERNYALDVEGNVRIAGAMNIKIPYSSAQNTYANYFKFINSEDTDVAHINVTGQGHLGLYANRAIEFMADGTRRFIIEATSTQVIEKKAGFYPEIDGTITLNSAGALSALGNGYNVGREDKFIRATYSKIIYLTDSVYIYYDTVNNCIRTNAPIVSDGFISAGGVSTT